jgi:endogenous inhibitor of DNA gyrase (YacG/DUF329 family)
MAMGETVCVYCRERAAVPKWAPFCGERCKLLDLRNWVDGRYRVPGEEAVAAGEDDSDRQP